MKRNLLLSLAAILLMAGCQEQSTTGQSSAGESSTSKEQPTVTPSTLKGNTTLKGTVKGLTGVKRVYLDRLTLQMNEVLADAGVGTDDAYTIMADVKSPGVYRLRAGQMMYFMILQPGEVVTLDIDLAKPTAYTISGSAPSEALRPMSGGARIDESEAIRRAKEATHPLVAWTYTRLIDIAAGDNLAIYKATSAKLLADRATANTDYATQLGGFVTQSEQQLLRQPVRAGKPAPDIVLPNPEGTNMTLSSLKGKVVLLDFWASWCRPCRANNPEVVSLYNQYKNQGFTVFSVSLDQNKEAWVKAIKDDKLSWPYHVSELRQWQGRYNEIYGIDAIPRTFLIDKNGIIVAINLQGDQLKNKVAELLKS
jgi:peroxiredoxin